MKKYFKPLLVLLLFAVLSVIPVNPQSWAFQQDFLDTAEDVGTNTVAVNGTDFTSNEIWISRSRGYDSVVLIVCEFTRAAGSASTVDFYFQVSYDDGTTWSNYDVTVEVATNTTVISGTTVREAYRMGSEGISHWRLSSIDNNDTSNALTACNASISVGRK